ncbi:hypothetical protein [Halomarina rubra]|uniref:Uncharacterized protein n=1 Tax=Halomarina rubra TaxID=2071873 RepID=A0ABD6AS84_9EURY|nr:hypothetical protein [Halomarina rubra]
MSNPLHNPVVRYGMGASSAAVLLIAAFVFVDDGTMRYLLAGLAAVELVVVPQFLKYAANQETDVA